LLFGSTDSRRANAPPFSPDFLFEISLENQGDCFCDAYAPKCYDLPDVADKFKHAYTHVPVSFSSFRARRRQGINDETHIITHVDVDYLQREPVSQGFAQTALYTGQREFSDALQLARDQQVLWIGRVVRLRHALAWCTGDGRRGSGLLISGGCIQVRQDREALIEIFLHTCALYNGCFKRDVKDVGKLASDPLDHPHIIFL
jgi:hypothetical protein